MSRVVAIGSGLELAGYALAGVEVAEADDPEAVRRAWDSLDEDVAMLVLTPEAAAALPDRTSRPGLLSVELPE